MLNIKGKHIETGTKGFLANLDDWSEELTDCLADIDQLTLTAEHWKVLKRIGGYYAENGIAPNLHIMTQFIGEHLGEEYSDKKHLFERFPYGPAQTGCPVCRYAKTDRLRLMFDTLRAFQARVRSARDVQRQMTGRTHHALWIS